MKAERNNSFEKFVMKILLPIGTSIIFISALFLIKFFVESVLLIHFGDKLGKFTYFNIINLFAFIAYLITILLIKFTRERIWFFLTLIFMLFMFYYGIFAIHIFNPSNFLSNLGILITLVLFSVPIAMKNLKDLFLNF